jgi:hypothetical protein
LTDHPIKFKRADQIQTSQQRPVPDRPGLHRPGPGDAVVSDQIDIEKFTKFPNWVFRSRLNPPTRMVYLVLLSYDWQDKRVVWPSVQTISEKANIAKRTAYKSLRELEKAGLITPESQYADFDQKVRKSNRYVLHKLSQNQIEHLCRSASMMANGAQPGAPDALPGAPDALPGAPDAHEVDKGNKTKVNQTNRKNMNLNQTQGNLVSPGCAPCALGDTRDYQGGTDDHRNDHRGDHSDNRDLEKDSFRGRDGESDSLATEIIIPEVVPCAGESIAHSGINTTRLSGLAENNPPQLSLRERLENHR